ncbi:ABC transporter ATP-binding protein [Mycoplasmoides pirum]|uniref:ABC transporter ATP-binding protein n=1 Tax=Mycoplasmoides pirum TaxID=2122 RepID=UPI000697ABF1|nr:ABC transporter ATP-binding protein [Mycoplasmoides pirum]
MHNAKVLSTDSKLQPFKLIKRILKEMEAKKSVWFISLTFALLSSAILAFSSFFLGYAISALITPNVTNPDGLNTALANLDPVVLVVVVIGSLLLMYVSTSGMQYVQNVIMVKISQTACARLRWDAYCKLQKMPVSYFDTHSSGDLMSRLSNDIDNVSQALVQSGAQLIQGVSTLFFVFIILMILNSAITLIIVPILFLMLSIGFWFTKKAQPYFIKQQDRIGDLNGYMEEMISGHKIVMLLNRQNEVYEKFQIYNQAIVPNAVSAQTLSVLIFPWFGFAANLVFLAFALMSGFLSSDFNSWGVSDVTSFTFLASYFNLLRSFTNPINQSLSIINLIQAGLAGAQRSFTILDLVPPEDKPNAKSLNDVKGYVKFDHVNFGYRPNTLNLKNANIEAKPGEMIAIVGPTGAGKTTIINLLTKFYNYNDGKITIDDSEISNVIETSWRDNISIVLQDTYLFTSTIKENIRYGNLNATDEEIIEVAKIANAHDFIMQLKDGYDTIVESNGRNFSQGQRQLLAIARAIVRNSPILLLDEATSSVDTRTEVKIQKALDTLMKGKTSFVIAHRLSTIKNANKILVVNSGEIVEQGSHDELLKLNGFYANLYNSQFKKGVGGEFELD